MTTEEMRKELKEKGYSIHKKMDEKQLKRRNEIFSGIFMYCWSPDEWSIRERAQAEARNKIKERFGSLQYHLISDEDWPKIKMEAIQVAKDYIDKRRMKMRKK